MSVKHTPGPWKAEGIAKVQNSSSLDYPITDQRGACIAHVIFNEDGGDNREKCHADARLIAAAPDLLESLERVVAIADRNTVEFNAAKAAIAKAKGEQL